MTTLRIPASKFMMDGDWIYLPCENGPWKRKLLIKMQRGVSLPTNKHVVHTVVDLSPFIHPHEMATRGTKDHPYLSSTVDVNKHTCFCTLWLLDALIAEAPCGSRLLPMCTMRC